MRAELDKKAGKIVMPEMNIFPHQLPPFGFKSLKSFRFQFAIMTILSRVTKNSKMQISRQGILFWTFFETWESDSKTLT